MDEQEPRSSRSPGALGGQLPYQKGPYPAGPYPYGLMPAPEVAKGGSFSLLRVIGLFAIAMLIAAAIFLVLPALNL